MIDSWMKVEVEIEIAKYARALQLIQLEKL